MTQENDEKATQKVRSVARAVDTSTQEGQDEEAPTCRVFCCTVEGGWACRERGAKREIIDMSPDKLVLYISKLSRMKTNVL